MKEHTQNIIETLYPMNRCLLGEGYDNALTFIQSLVSLDILEFPSGTEVGTWTVPDEWVIRDGWVKDPEGNVILDYKTNPLSVVVGSEPVHGFVDLEELRAHWHYSEELPDATPYVFKYYDKDWGFCFPKNQLKKEGTTAIEGVNFESGEFIPKWVDKLNPGMYEVFIDSEYRKGTMKLGVHTIPGKSDREILLFAHLDHPFQANDNLSGVACLLSIASQIKTDKTVKIVFCPETIGSHLYALTQDVSKVDFVLAVDICGNNNPILLQKSFNDSRVNAVAHLALQHLGQTYSKGIFRGQIGSDESVFNDPLVGVPGIMLTTWPYKEYHTSEDTPEKINYESIERMGKLILTIIEYWDKDFIPKREFKGQLMRSRYGAQSRDKQTNLAWDYFIYCMDGKKYLSELCSEYGLNFNYVMSIVEKIEKDGKLSRADVGEKPVKKTRKQK
jgi:aminopeptidase-like protein